MAKYTDPELRERIKEEIEASDKGGRKGQWSARKSQLLTREYERRGGGYVGKKDERQKSLERWGEEDWQTKEGDARARKGSKTKRYLPKKAWDELTEAEKRATDAKKQKASGDAEQFVPNTKAAKGARTVGRLEELPVREAVKLVGGLDKRQLRAAVKREREGKGRKTLLDRLEAELDRR